jgi:ubiquinone biosynthesis protein
VAAVSLAHVHAAVLKNGDAVVIKVQRPNIQATVETDLAILKDLAALSQHTEWGERNHPEEIAEGFELSLRNELDYSHEGRNADRFRKNFTDDDRLYVPTIYWKFTTRRVLIMERLEGIKVDDIPELEW